MTVIPYPLFRPGRWRLAAVSAAVVLMCVGGGAGASGARADGALAEGRVVGAVSGPGREARKESTRDTVPGLADTGPSLRRVLVMGGAAGVTFATGAGLIALARRVDARREARRAARED
ncbi:hypothetical protein ACH429_24995 [Streptomyces pathocidini]|uniref:Uncharacterized protein n=1 Tax=Streptomyces pathocidini TaxID=1650571 RepID=A0ABW7UZM0_9ACTN